MNDTIPRLPPKLFTRRGQVMLLGHTTERGGT
jgi:hypothetical protein